MKKHLYLILFVFCLLSFSAIKAQDTLVGWTFPNDSGKYVLANIGNELNKGGMYMEADSINEIPFTTVNLTFNGYKTKSASSANWIHAKDLKCWKCSCDATGYKSLKLYARVSSDSNNPGPRDFKIQYRMGCCSPIWKDVPGATTYTVSTDWTTGFLNGISIPADADNMSGFQVRFVCTSDTATDGSILKSTSRSLIDEVFIIGTKITSINEKRIYNGIEIYPNPASDIIQVKAQKTISDYKLFDLSGKLLKSAQINASTYKIFCSDLKPGCYFIEFKFQDNYHFNQKIIIR